jgi:hypothetical protein
MAQSRQHPANFPQPVSAGSMQGFENLVAQQMCPDTCTEMPRYSISLFPCAAPPVQHCHPEQELLHEGIALCVCPQFTKVTPVLLVIPYQDQALDALNERHLGSNNERAWFQHTISSHSKQDAEKMGTGVLYSSWQRSTCS